MSSKEISKKKVSNSKNAMQKSDRAIDSSSPPAGKMIHEQLGLLEVKRRKEEPSYGKNY